MNVKELKEKLAGMPEDVPVIVSYAIVSNGNYTWHMPVPCFANNVLLREDEVALCELDLAVTDGSCCVLVPELLSDEIVRRARKERERDG